MERQMRINIYKAFHYWFRAIFRPVVAIEKFKKEPQKLEISLWLLLFFSLLYSVTALLLYRRGVEPAFDPWMPIASDRYYLYQTFWTIPWGLSTGILMAGIAHVMAVLGLEEKVGTFEDALAFISIAWVVPSFVLMWVPETLFALFFKQIPWPDWVEIMRLAVLAPVWQVALTVVGARITHHAGWVRGIWIGLVTTGVSFLMFLPFMR
jgi:hypothetical protein